jgi:hypothetical protein
MTVDVADRTQIRDVNASFFAAPSGDPYARGFRDTGDGSCASGVLDAEGTRAEIGA